MHQGKVADKDGLPNTRCLDAIPGDSPEVGQGWQRDALRLSVLDNRSTQGVLRALLCCGNGLQQLLLIQANGVDKVGNLGASLGDGSCFVQNHRFDLMSGFQRLTTLYEDAALGTLARTYHDGGWRGQPQSAGAGDDEHRDEDAEREFENTLAFRRHCETCLHGDKPGKGTD